MDPGGERSLQGTAGAAALAQQRRELPRRPLVGFLLGAALALLPAFLRSVLGGGRPEVFVWAVDREAGWLIGLDRDLYPTPERIPMLAPTHAALAYSGAHWIASAAEGHAEGAHRLWRADPGGRLEASPALGPVLDLAVDGEQAWVVERIGVGASRVVRLCAADPRTPSGEAQDTAPSWSTIPLAGPPTATCVATCGGSVLVGHALAGGLFGMVQRFAPGGGAPVHARVVFGGVVDVEFAPHPAGECAADDGAWVLTAAPGGARLVRLGADLSVKWSRATRATATRMAVASGGERVWLADEDAAIARCYGREGRLEVASEPLSARGLRPGLATPDGGVLLFSPGAILRLDRWGAALPGQGGFRYLTALVGAAPPSVAPRAATRGAG